jgi:AraC-like DNA-binding protein
MTETAAWFIPTTRAIWLPAGVRHSIRMQGEVALRTLYIDAGRAAPLSMEPAVLEVAPLLRELILHILCIGMLSALQPEHDRLGGLLIDLLLQARNEDFMLPLPRNARAARLAELLLHTPADNRELSALASHVGASLRTLQRLFPQETGMTIESWRQKARLIHSASLLSTGASVARTALDCGYLSLASFSTAFRKQFGESPGRYRLRQR